MAATRPENSYYIEDKMARPEHWPLRGLRTPTVEFGRSIYCIMNTLTSDTLVHFGDGINDLWNICKMMNNVVTKYYIDQGLDYAGIKVLRTIRKTVIVHELFGTRSRSWFGNIDIRCIDTSTTNALETKLNENLYYAINLVALAFDESKKVYMRMAKSVDSYYMQNVISHMIDLEQRIPKLSIFPNDGKDDPIEDEINNQIEYGKFVICVYNMFNAMRGRSNRVRLLTVKHGFSCYYCGTINCDDECSMNGSFSYKYSFILFNNKTETYRTNWFYKKNINV